MSTQSANTKNFNLIMLGVKIGPKLVKLAPNLIKTMKAGKVVGAVGSAAAYSYLLSWEFAVMIMSMLFIHESGHVWAMRDRNIKTRGFYFIPMVGGAAIAEESFKTREDEIYTALMGPMWGLGLTIFAFCFFWYTANPLWASVTSWFALVNLINMLPVNPLDGGRVLKSIAFSIDSQLIWFIMLLAYAGGMIWFSHVGLGLFVFFGVIGFSELIEELKNKGSPLGNNFVIYLLYELIRIGFRIAFLPFIVIYEWIENHSFKVGLSISLKELIPRNYFKEKAQIKKYLSLKSQFVNILSKFEKAHNPNEVSQHDIDQYRHKRREILAVLNDMFSFSGEVVKSYSLLPAYVVDKPYFLRQIQISLPNFKSTNGLKPPMSKSELLAASVITIGMIWVYWKLISLLSEYPDAQTAFDVLA